MLSNFVALDLETTGLHPEEGDEIIEVAAVRFQEGRAVEEFHTLVNPHRPVPEAIQRLTGISPQELTKAPSFAQVADRVVAFLGSAPVVGHNLAFDLSFLTARGVKPSGPAYDTYPLACLLYPQLSGYSLASVARQSFPLGRMSLPAEHRAHYHARATGMVLMALQSRIETLPFPLRAEIGRLGRLAGAGWHTLFSLHEAELPQAIDTKLPVLPQPPYSDIPSLTPRPDPIPLPVDSIGGLLEPGGALEAAFPGFEHRPEQVHMARAVAEALNQGQQLVVEAGTGTGKSLAYLLPALLFAGDNQVRIVLSTNTINLQEQLVNKDIPQLRQALGQLQGVRTATLKGRANYLCRLRWDSLRQGLVLSPEEALFLGRTLLWLAHTQTGDRAELHLLPNEAALWKGVAATEENCPSASSGQAKEACHYYDEGQCFLFRARHQAEQAHVVVTNHALLLSEVASGAHILPDYRHLIIDEAHHLEDEATEQLGVQLTSRQIGEHLNQIGQKRRGAATGLLAEVAARVGHSRMAASRRQDVESLLAQGYQDLEAARLSEGHFFQSLGQFITSRKAGAENYERRLRLTSAVRARPGWSDIEVAGENLTLALHGLGTALGKLHSALESWEPASGLTGRLASCIVANSLLTQQAKALLFQPEKSQVYWATARADGEAVGLGSAPLQVGEALSQGLYSQKACLVLTSATLSTQGNLNFARERLGLKSAQELVLGSSFDYPASALIYILEDIPLPDRPGYREGVEAAITALAGATGGRTLGLFTSYAALNATLEAIRPRLEAQGIQVLGQGMDGPPQQLLETFRNSPRAVLLGTSSFWEGIDIPDVLSLLIIPRLPFPVPTDPIFEARCEQMEDGFNSYALPQAILRLKQGFGRLIRRRGQRGAVVFLDRRIKAMSYGNAFLQSLPQCTVKSGPARHMVQEVRAWLGDRV